MCRFYAGEGEYLEVNQRAGPRLCLPGPAQLCLNPVTHHSITVRPAILVSSNEALVVYCGTSLPSKAGMAEAGGFERKVLYGPLRYVPQPSEWIHEFSWHGEDTTNKTRKIKGALQFKLLRVIADQFYYNVSNWQLVLLVVVVYKMCDYRYRRSGPRTTPR